MPKITVIIPAHNEENLISKTIDSVLEADYPNKEIIVVDDASQDRTYQLANFYAAKGLIKLVKKDVASGTKASALNYGLLFANGEVVVPIDADTLIEPDALKELLAALKDPDVSAVSGNVRILSGDYGHKNLLVRLQAYEYLLSLELGRRFSSKTGTLLIISGAFGAFQRKYVDNLGKFDKDTVTEDFDITVKFRKLGKKLVFAENAVSCTFAPETWSEWRRQRTRWSRGQAETLWKHRNVLWQKGFDPKLVFSIYNMLLIDVVFLVLRFFWLFSLILFFPLELVYILPLSLILYFVMEFGNVVLAKAISPRRQETKNILLIPIMVLVYRPYYALVRLDGYLSWIFKRKSAW